MGERIAIIASELCKQEMPEGKPWMNLAKFVEEYGDLLRRHTVWATQATGEIIADTRPDLAVRPLGPSTKGVTHLAALVALGEIDRVLFFTDPRDQEVQRPENVALLRNCALHDRKFCVNETAYFWAAWQQSKKIPYLNDGVDIEQTLALIADDAKKPDLFVFVLRHWQRLKRFRRIIATEGTRRYLSTKLSLVNNSLLVNPAVLLGDQETRMTPIMQLDAARAVANKTVCCGPSGGDVVVAHEIYQKRCQHVVFFFDPDRAYAHQADIMVLLRASVDPHNEVNLMLNWSTADEWCERYLAQPA